MKGDATGAIQYAIVGIALRGLSFNLFHATESKDAKIVGSQRFTFLVMVVVIFADDPRLLPSPSERPADSEGSPCYADEFERPLRMLLVK